MTGRKQRGRQILNWLMVGVLSFHINVLSRPSAASAQSPDAQSPDAQSPDAQSTDVPVGQLRSGVFDASAVFPGTSREYRVYVPAQYDPAEASRLMVFMDGLNYANPQGAFAVPRVLDALIAAGEVPSMIAVFVNPGTIQATRDGAANRSNRSFEYDSLGPRYSKFLIEEFLPVALEGLNVSAATEDRAVCGISSSGICAFTTAWERPDQFGKVMSHIGSFTNIRGGWAYPGLIRKTKSKPKPIKVYLQEGKDDLSNLHGNWPLGNEDMAAALAFAGYHHKFVMTEGGHSGKWAGEVFPDAMRWLWNPDSTSDSAVNRETKPKWTPHPDAVRNELVPRGEVISMPPHASDVFAGTIRDWSIYVPAQYRPDEPAALMVFQDGMRLANENGRWRIPIVFDNLIARGDMPPTIGVFINPGQHTNRPRNGRKFSNRGYEYDSLGNRYATMLLDEILPQVASRYNISKDPNMRAIGGSSSGAICAWTVAWERTDQFRKVYSSVGSFTNLRGGNAYPGLIRKTEPKPIRIYMADTSGDVDNAFGSWPIANRRMASALQYMGYDSRFDWAEGYAHNADYGSSRFPDAMKWLWRNEVHEPQWDTSDDLRGDLTLLDLLVPGESWEVVAEGLGFADAPCADADGNFYFSDMREPAIYRINAASGMRDRVCELAVSGLSYGADGLLYGCNGRSRNIVSVHPKTGAVTEIATDVRPNDLVILKDGTVYFTETAQQHVSRINVKTGERDVVDTGILRPNGIAISNDGGSLAVSAHGGISTWTFRVGEDGQLNAKMPTMPMRLPIAYEKEFRFNEPPPYADESRGDGMCVDRQGRFYVTSALGVQIFDPTGRPCGVLPTPNPEQPLTSCVMAGPDHSFLYVTNGDTIFRRKLAVTK